LRFTVRRPPCGEVSLCWYRPSGGDVARRVHVGVARPRFAGDAREDRLALTVFGCDVPASAASLRRVRGRDPFESARSFVVESGNQPTPPLTTDRTVEASFLRNPDAGLVKRAARGAAHRPHVELFHSNGVEPARQIGSGLFHPVAPSVGFARLEFGDRELGALSAVGATLSAREALLQPTQPDPFTGRKARGVQQLPGREGRRYRHTAIHADHAAIRGAWDRVGDVCKGDMPAAGPIPGDAVGLDTLGHRTSPAESDPADLRYPHLPVAPVELFDMVRLERDLAEAFMHAGLTPRRAAMGAGEEVLHGLGEVPQRLLLHRLRPGREPVVFGADLSQLCALLGIARRMTSRLPKLLLLDGQVPHEPGMPAMLNQHQLLSRCWQQPKPRHTRKVTAATDTNEKSQPIQAGIGVPPRYKCWGFPPKEVR
jgi:hypothetical protein